MTLTTIELPALLTALPLLSVSMVSCQQVPQAGPAPWPGPLPNSFWGLLGLWEKG